MALFVLSSNIIIGSFQFSGVHEVRVQRSIHSLEDRATITIPAIARIVKKGKKSATTVTTATMIHDGDAVHINLGYNGDVNSEFVGFVKRRGTGMPLVVECEGYSYQLRNKVNINKDYTKQSTTAKDLLELATKGTDITVNCAVDFTIKGIKLINFNGLQICNKIMEVSEQALSIFFIDAKTLWCGLTYTAYAANNATNSWGFPTIDYRLGWNCIKDNELHERTPSEPVQVVIKGKNAPGDLLFNASKEKKAQNKITRLNSHIGNDASMGKVAQEKAFRLNYSGYEGKLNAFLQPYANIGMDAHIVNKELPDLNGKYLIEETDVTFGVNGARRKLTIGPRVGFDSETGNSN